MRSTQWLAQELGPTQATHNLSAVPCRFRSEGRTHQSSQYQPVRPSDVSRGRQARPYLHDNGETAADEEDVGGDDDEGPTIRVRKLLKCWGGALLEHNAHCFDCCRGTDKSKHRLEEHYEGGTESGGVSWLNPTVSPCPAHPVASCAEVAGSGGPTTIPNCATQQASRSSAAGPSWRLPIPLCRTDKRVERNVKLNWIGLLFSSRRILRSRRHAQRC